LLVVVLAVGGRLLLRADEAATVQVRPIAPRTQASAQRLVVHVVGAVRAPGLYRLRQGSRVADALARAGGVTRKAQVELVNLAAPIADGQQIVVPRRGAAGAAGQAVAGSGGPTGPVHLNTATLEQLDALPGIGPVTAQKILDFRQEHGAFGSVDELDAIPGIGPARLDQLRDLVAP
jgi:competence protein ComEA